VDVYRAEVRNKAKLAYNSVAAWLDGNGPAPAALQAISGLAENLRLQDKATQLMKNFRHDHGALSLDSIEAKPIFDGDEMSSLEEETRNRAKELIEDCMIAANGVTARFLAAKKFPSIRRVVRVPARWDRIVLLAGQHGFKLPDTPDSKALEEFLTQQKKADPLRFPDLSLSIIKLLGKGEYVAELPGENAPGHFGLAVKDYAHSTAPNRRFTDLITQRLVKAALDGKPAPYAMTELTDLATHCTETEDIVNKVERQVGKSAAALLLEDRIGEQFDALITGASIKGTWVRLIKIPVEGKLMQGYAGLDVGDRVRVQLILVDVMQGFIDFKKV
jgi:exoribonuclease-2